MKIADYHYSGKSTPEALAEFERVFLSHYPRWVRWLVKRGVIKVSMGICCDGCGVKTHLPHPAKLIPFSDTTPAMKWKGTEWLHIERLDFCPDCRFDGTAKRAVAAGVRPLGDFTMEIK